MTMSKYLSLLWLAPISAVAHVNWFVDHDTTVTHIEPYTLMDIESLAVAAGFTCILIGAYLTHRFLKTRQPEFPALRYSTIVNLATTLRVVFGVSILLSSLQGSLFAPHFKPAAFAFPLLAIQAIAGVLIISGKALSVSCALVFSIYCSLFIERGFIATMEYVNISGILLFIWLLRFTASIQSAHPPDFSGPDKASLATFLSSVTVLRLTLGVALITLGWSEKLSNPDLAMAFINQHENINFMKQLFPHFSDRTFILCCGAAEMLFGSIYILGFVTRINTIMLSLFMLASNSYFFVQGLKDLAWMELLGHSPLIASAIVLIIAGKGLKLKEAWDHCTSSESSLLELQSSNKTA